VLRKDQQFFIHFLVEKELLQRTGHETHSIPAAVRPLSPTNGVRYPGVRFPVVRYPGVRFPGVQVPGVRFPGYDSPGYDSPGLKVPRGTDQWGLHKLYTVKTKVYLYTF
jgi:hypothetical protein